MKRLLIAILLLAAPLCAQTTVIGDVVGGGGGGGGATDHGALTGLADNDHPQYGRVNCSSPTAVTLATGAATLPSAGGCVTIDTEAAAASDDFTTPSCTADRHYVLKAANDARTVVLKAASFAVYGAVDQSLDQDGDYALAVCVATDTLVVYAFYDEAGVVRGSSGEFAGSGPSLVVPEIAAPGAGADSGEHNVYFDSTTGRLMTHKNGGSALVVRYNLTHATDCTAVTVVGTGVALTAGDTCHELDADTNYVYDGAAWDLVGGSSGGASSLVYSCSVSTDATTPANTSATLATCTIGAATLSVGDICKWEAMWSFTDDGDATGAWGAYPTLNGTAVGDALMWTPALLNTEVYFAAWGFFSVDSTTVAEFFGNGQSEDDNFGANAKLHGTVDIDTTASMGLTFRGVSGGGQAADTIRFEFGSVQCWTAD